MRCVVKYYVYKECEERECCHDVDGELHGLQSDVLDVFDHSVSVVELDRNLVQFLPVISLDPAG
jgi:hypothetical protein